MVFVLLFGISCSFHSVWDFYILRSFGRDHYGDIIG